MQSSSSLHASNHLLPLTMATELENGVVSSSSYLSRTKTKNLKNGPSYPPVSLSSPENMDDLDLLICHEEFENLVALVEKVKQAQARILHSHPPAPPVVSSSSTAASSSVSLSSSDRQLSAAWQHYQRYRPHIAKSSLAPEEVLCVVERLREQLVSPGSRHTNIMIRRGAYPVTDATMDDNFSILQKELEFCEFCLQVQQHPIPPTPSTPTSAAAHYPPVSATSNSSSNNSTKYSKWQSDILLQWLVENHKDPTLSKGQARELAYRTGLTTTQVSTWLQNMRRRRRKNTIEGTKKATHFLDFLFLANERDTNGGLLPSHIEIEGLSAATLSRSTTPKRKSSPVSSSSSSSWEYPARNYTSYTQPFERTTPPVSVKTRSMQTIVPFGDTSAAAAAAPADGDAPTMTVKTKSSWDGEDFSFAGVQDNDSLFDGLQTVTESTGDDENSLVPADDDDDDIAMEPASLDFEVDEDLLAVFASNWHHNPYHIASPPEPSPPLISSSRQPMVVVPATGLTCPPLTRSGVAVDKKHRQFRPQEDESRDDCDGHDDFPGKALDWMDIDHMQYQEDYDWADISPASFCHKKFITMEDVEDDVKIDDQLLDHDFSSVGMEPAAVDSAVDPFTSSTSMGAVINRDHVPTHE